MFELILRGIGIGFSGATLPGPFQTYTINNSLALGWRKSIILILVPVLTDIPLIVLVVILRGSIPDFIIRVLQFAGGVILLWIAWGAWKEWRKVAKRTSAVNLPAADVPRLQILQRGVMIGLLSPGPYLFWGTINGPILIKALQNSVWHGTAFLLGFYGTFGFLIALSVLISDRLGHISPRITRGLILMTIIILLVFSSSLIFQGLSG